jgi:hypothetical protein
MRDHGLRTSSARRSGVVITPPPIRVARDGPAPFGRFGPQFQKTQDCAGIGIRRSAEQGSRAAAGTARDGRVERRDGREVGVSRWWGERSGYGSHASSVRRAGVASAPPSACRRWRQRTTQCGTGMRRPHGAARIARPRPALQRPPEPQRTRWAAASGRDGRWGGAEGHYRFGESCVCQVLQNPMSHLFRVFELGRPKADVARLCLVIPPEPPVADPARHNRAQQARARRFLARRSGPLSASTVVALTDLATGGSGGSRGFRASCW